jgi:hypothetical protein
VPWLWATAVPGSLVLWKFDLANYAYFYGLSFAFYLGTTCFSVGVYFYSTWNMKANVAPYKLPVKVEATLQLMVRFIIADVICNLGYTIFSISISIFGTPNPVLFRIAVPLLNAQGLANYYVCAMSQEGLKSVCLVGSSGPDPLTQELIPRRRNGSDGSAPTLFERLMKQEVEGQLFVFLGKVQSAPKYH